MPEYFLGNVCRALKLSASQTAVLAYALLHSQYRSLIQEALKLFKLVLPEISNVSDLTEESIQAVVHLITSNEVNLIYLLCDWSSDSPFFSLCCPVPVDFSRIS